MLFRSKGFVTNDSDTVDCVWIKKLPTAETDSVAVTVIEDVVRQCLVFGTGISGDGAIEIKQGINIKLANQLDQIYLD